MKEVKITYLPTLFMVIGMLAACRIMPGLASDLPNRESLIPTEAIKMTPANDVLPPKLLSEEFLAPEPLPYPVNTRGVEDSAFVMPDGQTLYVWFTPDSQASVDRQAQDRVTGIYQFSRQADGWSNPQRIWLADIDEPQLDGCGFFQGNRMWFCAVRKGLEGMHWFTSTNEGDGWSQPELADFNLAGEMGELYITEDGQTLYFHADRASGKGGLDIWVSHKVNGRWQAAENLENVNSEDDEGWPALNPQEDELWITRNYGLWRFRKVGGEWQKPELIVSDLAGEASLDLEGNLYFTHHYFKNDHMIEADIYVAYRK